MTLNRAKNFNFFNQENLIAASDILKANSSWTIFTHKKSDGDAMGSVSALFEAGVNAGKNVKWLTPDLNLSESYKYLSHFDEFITCENFDFKDENMLYVFLDCSNENRSVSGFDVNKKINALNIDHHEDNSLFGRVNCVDGGASSTCEMLFRVFKAGGWNINENIAMSLYTGIFTDTGGFSFSNTSALTHKAAAELIEIGVKPDRISDFIIQNKSQADFILWAKAMSRVKLFGFNNIFAVSVLRLKDFAETGADMTGTEGLSSMLMTIRGVKFVCMITEYPNEEIRLSIRSREGSPFSAGEFARSLGGGGHERAAGATLNMPIENAAEKIENLILKKYHEYTRPD